MRRRRLLALVGATAGTAGCLGSGESPGSTPAEETPVDQTHSPTDATTDSRTATETDGDLPDATDVFADFHCPSFTDDADETVCYHRAGESDLGLVLTAEPEVFDPSLSDDDVEVLRLTLYNRADWPVGLNPYDWGIERREGEGEWTHVAPDVYPEPWTRVGPGETLQWVLPSASGFEPADDGEEMYPLSVGLDPGVYAFHVTVLVEGETPTAGADRPGRVELVALFQVETAVDPGGSGDETIPSTETGAT